MTRVHAPAGLRPGVEGPVTLVFGTFGYRHTVLGWIAHARRAGCGHFRIVCMDRALRRFLGEHGVGPHALDVHDLLRCAPAPDLDAMSPRERLGALTRLRVKCFAHLAAQGCDFIHSDADAFWLADPRPWLARRPDFDLLCSQGTTHPRAHYHRHRFTLCAGFFACRASERSATYFAQVDALAPRHPCDQARMNAVLLRDPAARWRIERPEPAVKGRDAWFAPPCESAFRRVAQTLLRHSVLRAPANAALRLSRFDWILTSRELIHGRFTGGLTVGVVPMRIVMRGRFEGWGAPLVSHASAHKCG